MQRSLKGGKESSRFTILATESWGELSDNKAIICFVIDLLFSENFHILFLPKVIIPIYMLKNSYQLPTKFS